MSATAWEGALGGRAVFLSASVPDPRREREYRVENQSDPVYERVEDAHIEIEQAVVALARAVFSVGGRLVFGGHPSISPLVALVAGEYRLPVPAESVRGEGERSEVPSALVYQSRAYEHVVPSETWLLHRLGYAMIRWTDAVDGEQFEPARVGQPQCEKSLALMRRTMLLETNPVAMVCMGGMKGVRDEFWMFREQFPKRPVYVLESTGGAARWLSRHEEGVDPIDLRILEQLRRVHPPRHSEPPRDERGWPGDGVPFRYTPYPLILQTLVGELARGGEWR